FGVICFDADSEHIVVTQNRRDAPLEDTDSIQILLDTFNDDQNAFVFGTSPTGIEYDGQVSKAGQGRGGVGSPARAGGQGGRGGAQRGGASAFNLNWDGVWRVRSQITGRGWESEIVIPFRTLRYAQGSPQVWGLNIIRNLRRRNEQSFWAPVPRPFEITQVELAGDLESLEVKPHRNLQLLPYVLGGVKQNYTAAQDPSRAAHTGGLDVKYSLTPSLTLDATFNTDFAQVEVDEEQINLTRFDLFFPEKRPFFLENAGMFEFGTPREVELFFSRRIGIDDSGVEVPIDAGVRLSGKAGAYQIGVLNMRTREVGGVTPANSFSVARVSRELRNRSSVGFIGVNRQSLSRSDTRGAFNRGMGVDAAVGMGRYANWFSYAAKTQTPGLRGSDHSYASLFEYDDEHHRIDAAFNEVGRNFNPEVGFLRRAGYRKPSFGYRYTHYPEGKRLRSIFPHFQWNRWYTIETGDEESAFEHYHVDTRWQNGARLGIAWNRNFERIDVPFEVHPGVRVSTGRYHYSEMVANYGTDPTARFFASGNFSAGDFYGGTIRTINVNGGYRRGRNLTWTGGYIRNFIRLPEGDFNTDLIGLRFNWSFTPKSYLQSFTQYNSRVNQLGTNIRLALLSTSSTGLFLVYNSRVATIDYFDPHEIPRRTLSRALFVKFNYLFDF
ncbi:MAG: carbohydrate binding family 9 domain-containing protein, partial [Acidobacteria bacterium]|nr:carbohydrate binding family 9 domain-containing protein [Acidobacteriota bacterium]